MDFEGADLVNFGATESGTVITAAAGMRYRLNKHVYFGAAYERPVTGREDIIDERFTMDIILRY